MTAQKVLFLATVAMVWGLIAIALVIGALSQ